MADGTRPSDGFEHRRRQLDRIRGTRLLGRPSRWERRILGRLDETESILAVAQGQLTAPTKSNGVVVLTDHRLVYAGGRVYDAYVMRTAGTAIAELIASRSPVDAVFPLRSVRSVVPDGRHRVEVRSDVGNIVAGRRMRSGDFGDALTDAIARVRDDRA